MNFNIDNLKDDKPVNMNTVKLMRNMPKIIGGGLALIVLVVAGVLAYKYYGPKPTNPDTSMTQLSQENQLPIDHSGGIVRTQTDIGNMDMDQKGYEVLFLDTTSKVERIVLFEGNMDGSAPKADDTLESYVKKCYFIPDTQKTSCQKFYCAMWDGEDALSKCVFELLVERNLGGAKNFSNYSDYFTAYAANYFGDSYNHLSANKGNADLNSQVDYYILNVKKDPVTGFFNFDYIYSFTAHIENYEQYLPEGAFDYGINNNGQASFTMTVVTDEESGTTKDIKYYFHQTSDGSIFYNNDRNWTEQYENVGYLNRFELCDFVFYSEKVNSNKISKADINQLLSMGYVWTSSYTLEKNQDGKIHQIVIVN